jgi:predicted negative regulator of RcsB-dependent stress response
MKKFVSDNGWWLILVAIAGVGFLLYSKYKTTEEATATT